MLAPVVAVLAFVAPPSGEGRVGIAWHAQATVDAATRQRLADEVARELGLEPELVIDDAVRLAQRVVAYTVSRDDAHDVADVAGRLEAATALFRGGELDLARQQASAVLDQLRRAPHLPGAAGLAWQAHVLLARIEWTAGDTAEAQAALRRAAVLDPEADLSTRRVPPDVVELYDTERAAILDARASWARPALDVDLRGAQVEIDGRIGMRPLPPGEHFVVVRWLGSPPAAGVVSGKGPLQLQRPPRRIASGLPVQARDAERVCDELRLEQLVLARVRDGRLGLHAYRCDHGYGDVWYADEGASEAATWSGVEAALDLAAPDRAFRARRSPLLDRKPWPVTTPPKVASGRGEGTDGTADTTTKKPWYRRAWVWVLIGSVVVAGVTTGAVLGTREPDRQVRANFTDWAP